MKDLTVAIDKKLTLLGMDTSNIYDGHGLIIDTHDYPWRLATKLGISLMLSAVTEGIKIELKQTEFEGKAEELLQRKEITIVDFDEVSATLTSDVNHICKLTIQRIELFYKSIIAQRR